jgi:hypothetical protein
MDIHNFPWMKSRWSLKLLSLKNIAEYMFNQGNDPRIISDDESLKGAKDT